MLPLPTGDDEAVIIGLDPGTVMLGVAELTFNINTFKPIRVHTQTFDGARLPGSNWDAAVHGDRFRRISAHKFNLVRIFNETTPLFIASESPFYNRLRPNAYGALMEVICMIRDAIQIHSLWRPLFVVDPPSVKRAVGASGNADKEGVKKALMQNEDIVSVCDTPFALLDEHSIDAIAVAMYVLTKLKNGTLLDPPA